ncbi:uncharacterized protein LOC111633184 [Centruroides sculpturatus]|uniref:uncharacterized protein LOC111633184 n=1 Tax=Centruroides sculpturatus TaxID=218467 RepID=UPI000C6E1663|nr:uncharacterized protein LOC111633184 [Centruroides sculpturatus]XP_023233475.1 uncharacterized protein LOC111633184 [Centruroides sculpturatus]
MGRWRTPAAGICICLILILVLLTILFVVMSKHPEYRTGIASTDMKIMDRLSNVWCGWQEVSSSHPISTYRITGEPTIRRNFNRHYRLNFTKKLHFGKESQLQYFFLPGSAVDIRACTNKNGIFMRIFKSIQKWEDCLRIRRTHSFRSEDSSSEESDEDEDFGDHIKKFWKNQSKKKFNENFRNWYPSECKHFKSFKIPFSAKACDSTALSFSVDEKETYVFSLEDYHSSSDESQTKIHVFLNRTTYDIYSNPPICKSAFRCEVSLSFGSDNRAIIVVEPENDAGAVSYTVISSCKPRVFFFILLFVLIPLTVLLCIGCTIMLCKKPKYVSNVKYVEITRENIRRTPTIPAPPKIPLLAGSEVTLYSRPNIRLPSELISSPPPSYSQCSAPPSYTYVTSLGMQDKKKPNVSQC